MLHIPEAALEGEAWTCCLAGPAAEQTCKKERGGNRLRSVSILPDNGVIISRNGSSGCSITRAGY